MDWIHFVKKENYTENYVQEHEDYPVCTWNQWRRIRKKWDVQEEDVLVVFDDKMNYVRTCPANEKNCTYVMMSTSEIDANWAFPILKKYIHATDIVCVFPFSFYEEVKTEADWNRIYKKGQGMEYAEHTDIFKKYGISEKQIMWANYFTDTKQEIEAKLEQSSIVMLTGGAPDLMMKRIKEFKLKPLLKNYQGLMIGYSAGAMIELDTYHISPDDEYPQFKYETGLGCLHGFAIEPHYRATKVQKQSIEKVLDEKKIPVYGIYEKGGLLIHDDTISCFGKVDCFE